MKHRELESMFEEVRWQIKTLPRAVRVVVGVILFGGISWLFGTAAFYLGGTEFSSPASGALIAISFFLSLVIAVSSFCAMVFAVGSVGVMLFNWIFD